MMVMKKKRSRKLEKKVTGRKSYRTGENNWPIETLMKKHELQLIQSANAYWHA
jgi:hypothetical protein